VVVGSVRADASIGRETACCPILLSAEMDHGAGVTAVKGSSFKDVADLKEVDGLIGASLETTRGEGNTTVAGNGSTPGEGVPVKERVGSDGTATMELGTGMGDGVVAAKDFRSSIGSAALA